MRQIKVVISLIFILFVTENHAQTLLKPTPDQVSKAPLWAQKMYGASPNLYEIAALYSSWRTENPMVKNNHTQYFKRWQSINRFRFDSLGFLPPFNISKEIESNNDFKKLLAPSQSQNKTTGTWTLYGPIQSFDEDSTYSRNQCNIYSIDQSLSNPLIMYCGTETGMVFKSTNGGTSWIDAAPLENFNGGVTAIKIHPSNANTVFVGSGNAIYFTTNGGQSWTLSLASNGIDVNEFLCLPQSPNAVFAATAKGLYKSTNGGASFAPVFTEACYDIKANPLNPNTLYLLKHSNTLNLLQCLKSNDAGITWTALTNGWYASTDTTRNDEGGRLALTPADTNRVYAYLIGQAKTNDNGFIGLYRSDNGGASWQLPNGPVGGPYTAAHPNIAIGSPSWQYWQGYYNCAIMASNTDANKILIGGLNLWGSNDGGATWVCRAGYAATNGLRMHVDMQDFRAFAGGYWITTDGGINYSSDFFTTNPSIKTNGIFASDYWGFGHGWNTDVTVGGLYHNGNLASHQNYGLGNLLSLGGGEAPTGYVNPGIGNKVYTSDVGIKLLPSKLGSPIIGLGSMGKTPTESYWESSSSELEFLPSCYNIAFLGFENAIWKTTDGGSSFIKLYAFGANVGDEVLQIEISRKNKQVMFAAQLTNGSSTGKLWKTVNGGTSWTSLSIPTGASKNTLIALDATDENIVYIAYHNQGSSNAIFKSTNGGSTWTPIPSGPTAGQRLMSMVCIPNTNGGLYLCTNKSVYYKDNTMSTFVIDNVGLPVFFPANIAKPFFKEGKLRVASYGKGIWETTLMQNPSKPVAQIMVDKIDYLQYCQRDTFYFDDYSILNHTGASWNWTFTNATPSTSTLRNPKVMFNQTGTQTITLEVTAGNGQKSKDTITVNVQKYNFPTQLAHGFQGAFVPNGVSLVDVDKYGVWSLNTAVGGFGASTQSAYFNNYDIFSNGKRSDMRFYCDLSTSQISSKLFFDVAFARYSSVNSDTLQVLVSKDCGLTFTTVYTKGGTDLATAPDLTTEFVPSAAQWRKDSIDLSAFKNSPQCIIAFRNIGHYGNNIYLDNINLNANYITGISEENMEVVLDIFPNPIDPAQGIKVYDPSGVAHTIKVYDMQGKLLLSNHIGPSKTVPCQLPPGVYVAQLMGDNYIKKSNSLSSKNRLCRTFYL